MKLSAVLGLLCIVLMLATQVQTLESKGKLKHSANIASPEIEVSSAFTDFVAGNQGFPNNFLAALFGPSSSIAGESTLKTGQKSTPAADKSQDKPKSGK